MELSDRQKDILEAIRLLSQAQGYPPTVREIGAAVGLSSPASVHNHLTALQEEGLIRRSGSKRRTLELVELPHRGSEAGSRAITLPLVGRVAAGEPLLADENVEALLEIPDFLAKDANSFVVRVRGVSMVNAGILDGDFVVVQPQETAESGDIVVALLGEEATLKRYYRKQDHVRLQPENEALAPIITRNPRIIGKVRGVIRRLP